MEIQSLRTSANFVINAETVDFGPDTYYLDSYDDGTYGVSKNENVLERGLNRSQAGDYFQSLVSDAEDDALVRRNSRTSRRRV